MNIELLADAQRRCARANRQGNGSISITPPAHSSSFGLNIVTVSGGGFPLDVQF